MQTVQILYCTGVTSVSGLISVLVKYISLSSGVVSLPFLHWLLRELELNINPVTPLRVEHCIDD